MTLPALDRRPAPAPETRDPGVLVDVVVLSADTLLFDAIRAAIGELFVGLFIWGYLLGGIGALLAVPMTLLVLIIMENFEGTRSLAVLMRYTGEEKKEVRKEAAKHVKGIWGKVKGTINSDRAQEVVDEP